MKKRILIVLALLCAFAQGAMADKWDGNTMTQPRYLDGFYGPYYFIENAANLAYVRAHFSESTGNPDPQAPKHWYEADYELGADLDMHERGWEGIGNNDGSPVEYNGKFRGNGHSIEILTWDGGENYQGLFAKIGTRGEVSGVKLLGGVRFKSARMVGGIAGENLGTIRNCWVACDVTSNWHNSWSAYTAKVGGIAGENSGNIEYCLMTGNVRNDDADVGGLVGYNKGYVENCTFYGTRISSHSQHSVYFGDHSGTDLFIHGDDFLNDNELYNYLSNIDAEKYKLYSKGLHDPFTIRPINWGTVHVTVSAQTSRAGKTITVTYPEGTVVEEMAVQNIDGEQLKCDLDPEKRTYTFTMPKRLVKVYATVSYPDLTLWSDEDNSEQLALRSGKLADATLEGRDFYKDDNWNTICLPFSVPKLGGTPLEKATVQELTGASIEGGTLTLTFSPVTSIEAGKPYIVKWKTYRSIIKRKFKFIGVTPVKDDPIPVTFGGVTFVGQYSVMSITPDNIKDIIILTDNNKLGYSAAPRQISACRAHFVVPAGAGAITKVVVK